MNASVVQNVWGEHRPLLWLIGVYILVAASVLVALGRPYPIRLTTLPFAIVWLGSSTAWLMTRWLKSPSHAKAALEHTRAAGAVLVALLIVPTQITFQAVKQTIGLTIGFPLDGLLHRIDVLMHGGMPWQLLSWALSQPRLLRFLDVVYLAWFAVLLSFLVWLSWTSHRALRARALLAVTLLWLGAGNIAAAIFASAGPCYFGEATGLGSPYAPLLAALDEFAVEHGPLLARLSQEGLWRQSRSDQWTPFIGISAMPSLHVGAAVLMAIVVWRRSLVAGIALAAFAVLTQIGSVVLAWHYAIDGYAGAAFAFVAWSAAGRVAPRAGNGAKAVPLTACLKSVGPSIDGRGHLNTKAPSRG